MKIQNILLAFSIAFICACNKEAATPKGEVPVGNLIIEKDIKEVSIITGDFLELGLQFSAIKKGKITQIGAKMPQSGVYKVSIWDNETKKVIRQKQVEQSVNAKLTLVDIDPLPIVKDVKYTISIYNINADNMLKPYFGANVTNNWPFSSGNIIFHMSYYQVGNIYPNTKVDFRIYPNVDFTFVAD